MDDALLVRGFERLGNLGARSEMLGREGSVRARYPPARVASTSSITSAVLLVRALLSP